MTDHHVHGRMYRDGISPTATACLQDLMDDPDPARFLDRQRILGVELVRMIDLDKSVDGRHFRLICGIPELGGLMEGVRSALESLGATVCISVHYHDHRILNEDPLIETSAIYHSYNEPDNRPAAAIVAWSCLGNVKSVVNSLVSVIHDRKLDISEGLIIASPVMASDVKEEFQDKAGSLHAAISIDWYELATDAQRVRHGLPLPGVGGDPWSLSSSYGEDGITRMDAFVDLYRANRKSRSGTPADN
ncbi:hypothetical protein O9X98_06330 [Agrobacterium salinitolerans]|nr:hypothetical protein [Agrobacterium salinitolerans]